MWAPTVSETRGCGFIWAARSVEAVGPREAIRPRSAVPPSLFFLFHFLFYLFYFSDFNLKFKFDSEFQTYQMHQSKVSAWVAIVLYTFYANYVIHLCRCFQIYSSQTKIGIIFKINNY